MDVHEDRRLVAVRRRVDRVSLFTKTLLNEPCDLPVVFHHEDFHLPHHNSEGP